MWVSMVEMVVSGFLTQDKDHLPLSRYNSAHF